MLLSSYNTWRHGIKISKITFWGTQLYTEKGRKCVSSQWPKRCLKAMHPTSFKKKKISDSPDSPTATGLVENGLVTKIIQFNLFQEQNKLSRLSLPSSISVCFCNIFSNPHSLKNCTLGKTCVAMAVSSYSSSRYWRTKPAKTCPW